MSIMSFFECLGSRYTQFRGRASRTEFWNFLVLAVFSFCLILTLVYRLAPFLSVAAFFFLAIMLPIPLFSVSCRRFHDVGLSLLWLILFGLLVPIGWIAFLIVALWPGTSGPNRFDLPADEPRSIKSFGRQAHVYFGLVYLLTLLATQVPFQPGQCTKELFFVTEPRTAEGSVDYYASLMENYKTDFAQPERNGFRRIMAAVGPKLYDNSGSGSRQTEKAANAESFGGEQNEDEASNSSWRQAAKAFHLASNPTPPFADFVPFDQSYLKKQFTRMETVSDSDGEAYEIEVCDVSALVYDREEYCRNQGISQEDVEREIKEFPDSVLDFYLDYTLQQPWKSTDHPMAVQWLERYAPLLDLLGQAVREPYYLPYIPQEDDSPLIFMNLEPYSFHRGFAKGLRLRIENRIAKKRLDEAIDDIETCFRMANHVEKGPSPVCWLIGMAIDEMAASCARDLILSGIAKDAQLTRLDRMIRSLPPYQTYEQFFCLDQYEQYDLVQRFFQGKVNGLADSKEGERVIQNLRFVVEENQTRREFARLLAPFQEAAKEPCHAKRRLRLKESSDRFCKNNTRLKSAFFSHLWTIQGRSELMAAFHANLTMPAYEALSIALTRNQTQRKLLRLALAAERYKCLHGGYPENLEEAASLWNESTVDQDIRQTVRDMRMDPFTGKPTIQYRINPQTAEQWKQARKERLAQNPDVDPELSDPDYRGAPYYRPYFLYSLGSDGIDDKAAIQEKSCDRGGDWIW